MSEIVEVIKNDPNTQNEILQIVENYNKGSYTTRSEIGKNALIQSNVYAKAINIMGETIEDMDVEIEQKDKKK